MSKHSLLLVDGDARSLRVLEVSLRKAGFTVTAAATVQDALDKLELHPPELIISEITFPDGDGFELRRRVRAMPDWADIPFVFLTAELALAHKIRGLELGVDDYLTKPIYIKEIVTRINILLQKRQRSRLDERQDGRARFSGRVSDMPVVDVIQTVEISRKSGVIQFIGERGNHAAIYFRDGKVIDAEAGSLQAEDAVYRLLTWSDGEFEVEFRTIRRREVITTSAQGLLMEGMRRLDDWSRLLEQLPPLWHRFEVDAAELALRLGDVPDDNNRILRLIDGKRTLLEIIDASDVGDLECLQAISRLYFEGMLVDLDHASPAARASGRMTIPPVRDSGPLTAAPIERAAATAPIDDETDFGSAVPDDETRAPATSASDDDGTTRGPLLGGYRPSSLRLIDEAVAAAEAIEPSLFADHSVAADSGIPREIEADEPADAATDELSPHDFDESFDRAPDHDAATLVPRDESGLRMIGSLGRDRASASGELMPPRAAEETTETARELITIMPRRATREVPIITGAALQRAAVESPRFSEPRTPRPAKRQGPGGLALGLLGLAALLTAMAVYLRMCRPTAAVTVASDAPLAPSTPIVVPAIAKPETPPLPTPDAAAPDAMAADATPADATPAIDASAAAPLPDVTIDPKRQAAVLLAEGNAALGRDELEHALALTDGSIRLRHTARAYVQRAQVLQKLGRIDDALAAIDVATSYAPDYALAFLLRGRMLWGARRTTEARTALQRYLQLDPDGADAPSVHNLLDIP